MNGYDTMGLGCSKILIVIQYIINPYKPFTDNLWLYKIGYLQSLCATKNLLI